jgi:hypothetical protein
VEEGSSAPAGAQANSLGITAPRRQFSRGALVALALILIVAAAVRLIGIGQQSFSRDEISELRVAHASIADILSFGDGIPPLHNLLLHFLLPFGDSAGRVLSALVGVATVGVTWAWARRIGGIRVASYAASLVALSPFAVHVSTMGRADSLAVLLAGVSLWSLWVALDHSSTRRWVRWAAVSALGVYTHYLFVAVIAAGLLAALVELRGRPSRHMWIALGVLGMMSAPILLLLPADMSVQMSGASGPVLRATDLMYAGYSLMVGFSLGPAEWDLHELGVLGAAKAGWVWIALALPVLGLLSIRGRRALDWKGRRRLCVLLVTGLVLPCGAAGVSGYPLVARHLAWLVLPCAVWLAAGLTDLRPPWRWGSVAVLLAVSVSSFAAHLADPHHQVEDSRGMAAYLESSGAMDHPVLVLGVDRARQIAYYIDRPQALALPDEWDPVTGRLGYYPDEQLGLISIPPLEEGSGLSEALMLIDARTQPGGRYYFIYTFRAFRVDPQGELLTTLRARDSLVLVGSFAGLDVYRGVRA